MHSPANDNIDGLDHEAWGRTYRLILEVDALIKKKDDEIKLQLISAWGRVINA